MRQSDRLMLKVAWGLNYKEASQAWKLMGSMNLTIDEAAKKVIKDRNK